MPSETLAHLSNSFIYSAMAVYTVAMLSFSLEVAVGQRDASPGSRADRHGRTGVSLTVLAFLLHAAGVVTRGLSAGRPTWGNMYEFSITGSLAVIGAYLLLMRRYSLRFLGVLVVPAVLLTLGLAVTVLYTDSGQLVPALKSYWLVIHVSTVVFSAGIFTVGAAITVLYLFRARAERRVIERVPDRLAARSAVGATSVRVGSAGSVGSGGSALQVPSRAVPVAVPGWLGRLPAAERLDSLAYRVHAFAFPIYTFAVMAGAIWAENAWGRYWGWDPKETWAFVTWVLYAAYLHARATAGWRGGRAAAVALLGCAALWFNYYGVNLWFHGLHSYAGVG